MKKIIGVCVAAVLAATVLSGCSDEVNSKTSSSGSTEAVEPAYDKYNTSDRVFSSKDDTAYSLISVHFTESGDADGESFYETNISSVIEAGSYSLIRYLPYSDGDSGAVPYNYTTVTGDDICEETGYLDYESSSMPTNAVTSVIMLLDGKEYRFSAANDEWKEADVNMSDFSLNAYTDGTVEERKTVTSGDTTLIVEKISYDDSFKYLYFDTDGNLFGEGTRSNDVYTVTSICVFTSETEDRFALYQAEALS